MISPEPNPAPQKKINAAAVEEISFIDIRAEMAKETPVINVKPENNTTTSGNTDSTGSTTQAPEFISSPDDFRDTPVIENNQQQEQQQEEQKQKKSFKGSGKFCARYLEKGVVRLREWADLRLEFNAEERNRLKELIAINFNVKQEGDDALEKRYRLLVKEWEDVPFSEEEKTELGNDLEVFLSSIDFELSPGSALLFSIAMIILPRLAPLFLKMIFK